MDHTLIIRKFGWYSFDEYVRGVYFPVLKKICFLTFSNNPSINFPAQSALLDVLIQNGLDSETEVRFDVNSSDLMGLAYIEKTNNPLANRSPIITAGRTRFVVEYESQPLIELLRNSSGKKIFDVSCVFIDNGRLSAVDVLGTSLSDIEKILKENGVPFQKIGRGTANS